MNNIVSNIKKDRQLQLFIVYMIAAIFLILAISKNIYTVQSPTVQSTYSWVSTFLGIACVFFAARQSTLTYWVGVLAVLTYGTVALENNYIYDYLLNFGFFFPLQLIGFYVWKNHLDGEHKVKIRTLKNPKLLIVGTIIAIALLSTVLYQPIAVMLKGFELSLPMFYRVLDAATTVMSIIAQILMTLRMKEQWVLWNIVNGCSIIMWIYFGDIALEIMFIVYLINSLYGTYEWYKQPKIET